MWCNLRCVISQRFLSLSFLLCFLSISAAFGDFLPLVCAAEEGARPGGGSEQQRKGGNMADPGKLTEEEGKYLLALARETIEERLFQRTRANPSKSGDSPRYQERRGTFVTLTIEGALRGCIGHIVPQESLLDGVKINAINAAFKDPRFRPLSAKEWEKVKIEVSVLTDPQPLSYSGGEDLLRRLRPGIDGVILKKGFYQGTFLPQVWEQLPDAEEFLNHLCLKAGLDENAWRRGKLEVSTYQVEAFHER